MADDGEALRQTVDVVIGYSTAYQVSAGFTTFNMNHDAAVCRRMRYVQLGRSIGIPHSCAKSRII